MQLRNTTKITCPASENNNLIFNYLKNNSFLIFNFSFLLLVTFSCSSHKASLEKVNQRFDRPGHVEKVDKGIYWFQWLGKDTVLNRNMSINLLDIDLEKSGSNI
ncbi:MAG: hypothetical protein HC892_16985 [Saprospiraceae bacterium]|nr:hypothetical protein [Saprospiraceae bacterium]